MAFKQKNNPFGNARSSSLSMSSAFKAAPPKLEDPTKWPPEDPSNMLAEMERAGKGGSPDTDYEEQVYSAEGEERASGDAYAGAEYDVEGNVSPQDSLLMAAATMQNVFTNPDGDGYMPETGAQQKDFIENKLFKDVGYEGDSEGDPWSAAAVSNLATAFDPEFQGSAQHAQYINRAFQGEGNYIPTRIRKRTDFQSGDILFKGRSNGPEKYKDFKNAAKDGWNDQDPNAGYKSHSDIIIDTREKGGVTYYTVQGGNVGDTLKQTEYTAQQLADKYAGRLTQ